MKIPINIKSGELKKTSNTIIGIDLGTTHSLVAYMKDGVSVTVKDKSDQNALIPSIVHFDHQGKIIVGEKAKQKLIEDPRRTIYSVKRLMGKSYGDIAKEESFLGYNIIDNEGESLVKIEVDGKFYTPIELSAEILKKLKSNIEKELDATVEKAVITVPAYFNDAQRQATRDAGKLAGLDVLRIINEPTAASLAYGMGMSKGESKKIAIYDLGGGTFDISILEITDGIFDVLSTNGDTHLGGDDFDKKIIEYWMPNIIESDKKDASFNQTLRLLAEKAKKHLSFYDSFEGSIEEYQFLISKEKFESLIAPLVEKTISACQNAVKDAKVQLEEIDSVVMVGGSTRVPLVNQKVSEYFNKILNNSLDPDEVVALGAAIQADILAGNNKDMLLLDITPLSLGIETVGGLMDTIIPRNTKVPFKAGRNYTTSIDGQKNLKVSVYQGERDLVADNRKLGEFILKNIPPMSAGIPKIEVVFQLDADGILKVKASELRSGTVQEVQIKSAYGISEEEMAKMLLDSIKNAQTDMDVRALKESINEANNVLRSTEKFIEQNEDWLSSEDVKLISKYALELKNCLDFNDKDIIEGKMKELNDFTSPLAHKALDINISKALSGRDI